MAYSAPVQPGTYMAGYSAIPLRLNSTDSQTLQYYKYITNIAFSGGTISSGSNVAFGTNIFASLTFSAVHSFEVGDTIMIDDLNNSNVYSGYYNVMSVPTSTTLVADFTLTFPMTATSQGYRVIKYAMSPDLEGEAKLDLSNTIKDFVTEDFEDVNDIFAGPNTRFNYDLLLGQESNYIFEFEDNGFAASGYTNFFNSAYSQAYFNDTLPFQIGDQIIVEQDLQAWPYYDNFFYLGQLGFTGTTNHNYKVGQAVNITGQITAPHYNGWSTVRTVVNSTSFTVYKTFDTSTPAEAGFATGVPRPTYNTTATIVDMYWDVTYGVVITTDIPFDTSSSPLPGEIRLINDEKTETISDFSITGLNAYNARIETLDYGFGTAQFSPYVVDTTGTAADYYLSTILSGATKWRIERESKSWLLAHTRATNSSGGAYRFYDSSGTQLAYYTLANTTGNDRDFYIPVGLNQLTASTNTTLQSGSAFSAISSNIDYYTVELGSNANTDTNTVTFELNDDCSRYDMYHLMWKDRYGSWLSYPFKYISEDMTEVERKDYYKTEGTWDVSAANTFGYDTYGRGQKSYFTRSRDKHVLNSGWVNEVENLAIKDLMQSANVYIQYPDGTLVGAIIQNKNIKLNKTQSDYLWNYKFEVSVSTNEIRL